MVLLNKNTGEVAWVSAYPHGDLSDVNITEPAGGTGVRGKPNVALSRVQHEWQPIISGLLKEPIKDFRKNFKSIEDFNRYIGKEAAQTGERVALEDFGDTQPR